MNEWNKYTHCMPTAPKCHDQFGKHDLQIQTPFHAQVEPVLGSSLAATQGRGPGSNSSTGSHDGFVSVGSARSSSSNHRINSLPPSSQTASEPSGQLPTIPVTEDPKSQHGSRSQTEEGETVNSSEAVDRQEGSSALQPDASDPFQQSLDALHADQQEPVQQASSHHHPETGPSSREEDANPSQQTEQQPGLANSKVHDSASQQAPAQTPFQNPQGDAQQSKAGAASTSAAGGAAGPEGGGDVVNASPVGSASTDAWEMVQDANNIYNWKAGSLFGRSLSSNVRQGSECSEEGESYSQCKELCMKLIAASLFFVLQMRLHSSCCTNVRCCSSAATQSVPVLLADQCRACFTCTYVYHRHFILMVFLGKKLLTVILF